MAVPLTLVALWYGFDRQRLLGVGGDFLDSLCPTPDAGLTDALAGARQQEAALRDALAEIQSRIANQRGQCAPPAPPPEPTPPPPLPRDRWDHRDIGMLSGCWELISDMAVIDEQTKKVRQVKSAQMCFDQSGNGTETQVLDDGTSCEGKLHASFQGGDKVIIVTPDGLSCSDRSGVRGMKSTCTRVSDNEAECVNHHLHGHGSDFKSRFRR
jgi:hypothetical protein